MADLLLKDEVYALVGAAMEVYNVMGCGFLEPVYQETTKTELSARGIPFVAQMPLTIMYKGCALKKQYVADLCCYGVLIGEIKAIDKLTPKEEAQLLNYLHATNFRVGVLLNFGNANGLEWKRMVL